MVCFQIAQIAQAVKVLPLQENRRDRNEKEVTEASIMATAEGGSLESQRGKETYVG